MLQETVWGLEEWTQIGIEGALKIQSEQVELSGYQTGISTMESRETESSSV